MNRNREILRKLLEKFKEKHVFPTTIGERPKVLNCAITGTYYRISGETEELFPPEVLKIVGATQAEFFTALNWVARGSHEHYSVSSAGFFAFIPDSEHDWPKD